MNCYLYTGRNHSLDFQPRTGPSGDESHGRISSDAVQFFSEFGRRPAETTGDVRASSFSFSIQRLSVAAQRFNSEGEGNGKEGKG